MLKMIALFQFEPGLAREDAIHYHEMRHVPLICKLSPDIFLNYHRSYPEPGTTFFPDHIKGAAPPTPSFDVMSELWMEGRAEYEGDSRENGRSGDRPACRRGRGAVSGPQLRYHVPGR